MQNSISFGGKVGARGDVVITKISRNQKASLGWTLRNRLTWRFVSGWLAVTLAYLFGAFTRVVLGTRIMTVTSELALKKRTWANELDRAIFLDLLKLGKRDEAEKFAAENAIWIDYGVVSHRVITDAFVTYLRDDLNNGAGSADVSLFNFHGMGTGTNAEAAGDTALQTESTTALNPDSTRATGTRSTPASNQYRSTGTLTFDASAAITEHGVFTTSGTGSGTLMDRSQFTAVNVVSGDSIQAQYTITLSSGG